MNRLMIQALFCLSLCSLLPAQQPAQPAANSASETSMTSEQPSAVAERNQAIKEARTIHINSETVFLTASTMERALMLQKSWDKLNLNIVAEAGQADLELQINRLVFTHIHTYILTDRKTGVVLAAGRVRAFDGVVASGPMAEKIVRILSAARLPGQASGE